MTLPDGYPVKFCPVCKKQMFPRMGDYKQTPSSFKKQKSCSLICAGKNRAGGLSGLNLNATKKTEAPWKLLHKVTDKTKADFEFNPGAKTHPKAPSVRIPSDEEYEARIDGILAKVMV